MAENKKNDSIAMTKCCFCGGKLPVIDGSSPYPLREDTTASGKDNLCCSICSQNIVSPLRMAISVLDEDARNQTLANLRKAPYKKLLELGLSIKKRMKK
jgi:hypothetical protein